jgi:hypothetical protein
MSQISQLNRIIKASIVGLVPASSAGATATPMSAADLFGNPEPARALVRLERDCDRDLPCHDNLAVIGPPKGPHAGELRCAQCDQHRGWLPKQTLDFLNTTAARFGAPSEPIVLRATGANKVTASEKGFQSKPNTGVLFKNNDKSKDTDRDYSGSINMGGGTEFWLSGYLKVSKAETKYLSLSAKPKEESASTKPKPDDEITF